MLRRRFFLTTAACFLLGGFAIAQTTVHGVVIDHQGNLPNALVYLENSNEKITSDTDGSFTLSNVPDGSYRLIVEYTGYENTYLAFRVIDKRSVDLGTVTITEKKIKENNIQEVVVASVYKASQARAITMKRNSNTITEVLSADAIGKLPDRNAADAVQRMQGVSIERDMGEGRFVAVRGTPVQWTASTLNGNRMPSASGDNANRGVQMDIFPSELIQNVRLSKALTPDLDGDAIGGNVDFMTKTSPNKETLAISTSTGYVNMSRSPTFNSSIVYGNKITDKLKFISSAVIWERSGAIDQMRNIFNYGLTDPVASYSINQLQLRDYVANRRTLGFNHAMDYEINSKNKLYFKGLYSQYKDGQSVRETYFNFDNKNVTLQARHADYLTDLYSMQFGGNHQAGQRLEIDWSLSKARSTFKFNSPKQLEEHERGYPIVNFVQPMTYGNLASDGRKYFAMDAPDGVGDPNGYTLPYTQNPISGNQLKLNQVILNQNRNSETDLRGQVDLKYKVAENFKLQFGTKFNNKEKIVDAAVLVWMPKSALGISGASISYMNQFEQTAFPFNGGFMNPIGNPYDSVIINQISNGQIDQFYSTDTQNNLGLSQVSGKNSNSNITSSYHGRENVWGTYLMGTWKLNENLQFLGGVRNEYNDISFYGKKVISDKAGSKVEDIQDGKKYNVFLPMINMKWNLTKDQIIRAAYTKSFARPDFNDLNPGTIVNDLSNTITQGNTQLNPTFSNNFDLMFENYFGKLDMITAGAFYKDITDLIYKDQSIVNVNGIPYTFTTPKNLEGAKLYGFEVGISKRFENLPGFLKYIGFEGNYTYIASEMNMPVYTNGQQTGTMKTTIPNQAKHIFNTIVFYETSKFMLRLAGNYKRDYVSEIRTAAGPDHYQHFDKNFTVDASTSYSINKNIRLFVELNNIFNEPNRYYMGTKSRVENISYSGIRGQLGVNFNF
ncbi:TonB-dependent receptor [Chryseobacterium sp. T16E-39]|uniref:TonB-dependent receptor n=1 Tax=Chryseobacterium sp. T16E-39 TaxID=2015076 RepID=UPI000B5B4514|nr:TonB-dependent receptor [Chryseobacterium sp. T16E-39]ASK30255.1 TonB-dependent receptor [Chryseobacterium sp. T16E-39]